MFDSISVLGRPRRRFGRSAAVSLGLHLLVVSAVAFVARNRVAEPEREPPIDVIVRPPQGHAGWW